MDQQFFKLLFNNFWSAVWFGSDRELKAQFDNIVARAKTMSPRLRADLIKYLQQSMERLQKTLSAKQDTKARKDLESAIESTEYLIKAVKRLG